MDFVGRTPLYHGLKTVDKIMLTHGSLPPTRLPRNRRAVCRVINLQVIVLPGTLLGAKPKYKSFYWEMGGRVTGRAQRPEVCDATGWPALSSRQSASSTPVLSRTQPWTAAKGRISNKPPQQPSVQLENRFAPLLQDPGSPSDDLDNLLSSHSRVRTESKSQSKRLQGKLTTGT